MTAGPGPPDPSSLAEGLFPERTVTVVHEPPQGNDKRTARIGFADGEAVVVQTSDRPRALALERVLLRELRKRTPVPVARPRSGGTADGWGYLVTDCVPGEDLHRRYVELPADRRRRIAASFGRYLACVHDAFGFDGFGEIELAAEGDGNHGVECTDSAGSPGVELTDGDASRGVELTDGGGRLVATGPESWEEWLRPTVVEGIDALPAAFDDLRPLLHWAISRASVVREPPAVLYPWDLRPGNALVEDGSVSAVVDWGDPLAAAPGLSVAKTSYLVADWYGGEPAALREAFRRGYRSVRPLPSVRPIDRLAAVVRAAVDSTGAVTRPCYPEVTGDAAIDVHRGRLERALAPILEGDDGPRDGADVSLDGIDTRQGRRFP